VINRLRWHLHELDPSWTRPRGSLDRHSAYLAIEQRRPVERPARRYFLSGRPGVAAAGAWTNGEVTGRESRVMNGTARPNVRQFRSLIADQVG
jgi:hypothetical protein